MNYEELVEELNFETDNEERQKEAKALKKKLKRIGIIFLIIASILIVASITVFIILMIKGLSKLDSTILFSIIPFAIFVLSTFLVFFGYSYLRLSKQIIINKGE